MEESGAVSGVVISCSSPFRYSILVEELVLANPEFRGMYSSRYIAPYFLEIVGFE
jgi:hypothetical protein